MILRRLTEHVKAQNWFAAAIDFVIVVAARIRRDRITAATGIKEAVIKEIGSNR